MASTNLTPDDVLRVCLENWFGTNDIVYRSDSNIAKRAQKIASQAVRKRSCRVYSQQGLSIEWRPDYRSLS